MATTSGGSSKPLCSHCSTKFKLTEDNANCAFCNRVFHLHCVTGAAATEEIIRFSKKPTSSIFWGCDTCRAGIKRNKETIYNEKQVSDKLKAILEEKVPNKIKKITNEHKIKKETISIRLNLIRGYKSEIKELLDFKQPAIVAIDMAEFNKLKIIEFQKEIENLKIAHGNLVKTPRTSYNDFEPFNNHSSFIKELEPVFKKISTDINKKYSHNVNIALQLNSQNQQRQEITTMTKTRSTSNTKKNIQSQKAKLIIDTNIDKTFAQVVSEKADKVATIRTVIMPPNEDIKNQFMKENLCAELNIVKIINKNKNTMTVKCACANDANVLERQITDKYRGQIQVNKVEVKQPQIKATTLPTDLTESVIIEMINE